MALERQEGGDHYKKMAIQPLEFCQRNGLNFCEANVVKYVCRHREKGGLADIRKAIHYLEVLIELEYIEQTASVKWRGPIPEPTDEEWEVRE